MAEPLILASGSASRLRLMQNAGIPFTQERARVDEETVKAAMCAEAAAPRDIADALADLKAVRVAARHPDKWVLGADQVLSFDGTLLSKPATPEDAAAQLAQLSGGRHQLFSAAVIYEAGTPIWRHVGVARLQMRSLSDAFIADYVSTYWDEIRHTVGCYRIEEEGVRLFDRIEGDFFSILGLPILEIQAFLTLRGRMGS